MSRRRTTPEHTAELNLAPIMNMVMILIPLLLLSTVFLKTGVISVSSPRYAIAPTSDEAEQAETTRVPQLVVAISDDGFRLSDEHKLAAFAPFAAAASCDGDTAPLASGPTICLREDADSYAPLASRLDYAALYNTLVHIRLHPDWAEGFGEEGNDVVRVVADANVPFDALVATMDAARFFLQPSAAPLAIPSPGSDPAAYALPNGRRGATALANATPLSTSLTTLEPVPLFPHPILLTARPQGVL